MSVSLSRLFVLPIILFLLFSPIWVGAATVDELRAQLVELLARLQQLQGQLDAQGGGTGTTGTVAPGTGIFGGGLSLSRQLEPEDEGSEVQRLQEFLARDSSVYPEGLTTGYYGSLTIAAVKRFQAKCGIVSSGTPATTGYGRVGPSTVRALRDGCGTVGPVQSNPGAFMRITPISGNAPLAVSVEATVNTANSCEAGTYFLNFGDGSPVVPIVIPEGRCSSLIQTIPHTYTRGGSFSAVLSTGSHKTTVGVTVSGPRQGAVINDGPVSDGVATGLSTFVYNGKSYNFGFQGSENNQDIYEYPLTGQRVENWTELVTFVRDRRYGGLANFQSLEEAAIADVNVRQQLGAQIDRTFVHTDSRNANLQYYVTIMAFPSSTEVELDIKKMYLRSGEIVAITYGRKEVIRSGETAQDVMDRFFRDMDTSARTFIEHDFTLPWLVEYNSGGGGDPDFVPPVNLLSVSPTSGKAPFKATATFVLRPGDPYEIDWGDGTPIVTNGTFEQRSVLPSNTVFNQGYIEREVGHNYTKGGRHPVILKVGRYEQEGGQWVWRTRFFTDNVTVTGGVADPVDDVIEADPLEGDAPLTVTFDVTVNGKASCGGGTYTIEFGDGEYAELPFPADVCRASNFRVTHRYEEGDDYIAKLWDAPKTTVEDGGGTLADSVEIDVRGQGKFTLEAGINSDPAKVKAIFDIRGVQCTSYKLDWGDGSELVQAEANDLDGSCSGTTEEFEFLHEYTENGTYTVNLKRGQEELENLDSNDEETATITISGL